MESVLKMKSNLTPEKRKSAHEYIKKLRKEFHIKREDYKSNKPEEIKSTNLPVIDMRTSKKERKKIKKREQKKRYKAAKWYLMDYLKPEYSNPIFDYFGDDIEGLVDYACERVEEYLIYLSYDPKEKKPDRTVEEWGREYIAKKQAQEELRKNQLGGLDIENAPGTPVIYIDPDGDIPDIYWNAFELYCDDHPVKTKKQAKKRRRKFIKMVNKQYKKTYGKMATGKGGYWDTIDYMSVCIDKDRMIDNLKKMSEENAERTEKFKKEMEKFFVKIGTPQPARDKIMKHSKRISKSFSIRMDSMIDDLERMSEDEIQAFFHGSPPPYARKISHK